MHAMQLAAGVLAQSAAVRPAKAVISRSATGYYIASPPQARGQPLSRLFALVIGLVNGAAKIYGQSFESSMINGQLARYWRADSVEMGAGATTPNFPLQAVCHEAALSECGACVADRSKRCIMYVRDSCNSKRRRARHIRSRRDLLSMPWRSRPEAGGWTDLRQILASSSTAVDIPQGGSFARRDLHDIFSGDLFRLHGGHAGGDAGRRSSQKEQTPSPTFVHTATQTSKVLWNRELGIASSGSDKVISVAGSVYAKYTASTKCTKYPFRESVDFHARMAAPASAPQGGATGAWGLGQESLISYKHFSPEEQWRAEASVRCPIAASGPVGRDVALDSAWSYDIKDRRGVFTLLGACNHRDAATQRRTTTLMTAQARTPPATISQSVDNGVAQGPRSCW